jgi:hypothetical protein
MLEVKKKIERDGVNWVDLPRDLHKWRAVVEMVRIIRFREMLGIYWQLSNYEHHQKDNAPWIHKEKSNKMQQCIKILLFYIYVKLDMFRGTQRPLSGT